MEALKNIVELNSEINWGTAKKWTLMAGPDIFESYEMVLETATTLKQITTELGIPWIFKCSFDKANRQSISSFRGPGMKEALDGLAKIKADLNCPIITDVHDVSQVEQVAEIADVIQIPAFLSRQTDLMIAAAKTGKVLNIKKGQFMAPGDMKAIAEKAVASGNNKILLCDRGTSFGYHRLISDMTGLVEMRNLGYPVIMDATHSTQLPGATGKSSGGRSEMVPVLARAAMATGSVDGIFLETHPDPSKALCDGPIAIKLSEMKNVLSKIDKVFKSVN